MQKLSVCLISQQFGQVKSGIGVYTRNVAKKLLEDGHDVTLICPSERVSKDIPGLDLHPVSGDKTGSSHIRWFILSWRFGKALRELLEQRQFHLIHYTDAREALFCPRVEVPLIANMNDYYFAAAPFNPLRFRADYVDWLIRWTYYHTVRLLERKALRKLTVTICNSRYTKNMLVQAYRLPQDQLRVIYKSIDVDSFSFHPQFSDERRRRVLFVGGNLQRKGLPTVIRSAPIVLEKFPDTEFSVIGDNQNLQAMKDLCGRYGVKDSFNFLGWQSYDQIQKHYQGASVFVMPSLIEAFGVVFLEAMASGIPVIGGDVGGTRELIRDGFNGFLVDPKNSQDLADKIMLIFQNEKIRQKLIQGGLETVKRYTVEAMVQETYDVYKSVIN
jgi:glycosyltransferase involved in cell wall biosynthesis